MVSGSGDLSNSVRIHQVERIWKTPQRRSSFAAGMGLTYADLFELSVSDKGDPIPDVTLERLFQLFFRGAVRASQQGLGLGLYIASEITRAHGGTLAVASPAAETRFTFQIPLV